MKKLRLDILTVESFTTVHETPAARGTVHARRTASNCPDSWEGVTCYVTCAETCGESCYQVPPC
jgi:hypothetical protein